MIKVHLDTDFGGDIDDLCALALLLKWPGVEITGVTTASDEGGRRAGYARYALRLAGREGIPVAAGTDVDQFPFRWRPTYYAESAYWPEPVAPAPGPVEDAIELMRRSIEAGAVLAGIGPMTNFALLERRYPGLLGQTRLYQMGGYMFPVPSGFPQWGNDWDYNLQMDPLAAGTIIEKYDCTLVPLSVTAQTALRRSYLPGLHASGPLGALIARQAEAFAVDEGFEEKYGRTHPGLPDDLINFQHDPLACAVALGWEGVTIEEIPLSLEIEDGWLHERVDPTGVRRRVVTAVDGPAFSEVWYHLFWNSDVT
jgi:inosine-uridine nucleoside N-ribohydrolase